MRLVFMFHSEGAAPCGSKVKWDPRLPSANKFVAQLATEGTMYMLECLNASGIVDDLFVVIESNRGPGCFQLPSGVHGLVMPNVEDYIDEYLRPDDILFVRGGFKTWHDWLVRQKGKRWMLLYAANTGRERWPFWDVIFNDLKGRSYLDGAGRFHLYYRKPTNPLAFRPLNLNPRWDLCIGASHIHDKKAQWKTIRALPTYEEIYGRKIKCVLPGAPRRGVQSNQIPGLIKEYSLDVEMPGHVRRDELVKIYNQSRVLIRLGADGQNDRAPLEALACGTPLILANKTRHSPVVWENPDVTTFVDKPDNPVVVAQAIHEALARTNKAHREKVAAYYQEAAGLDTVILPQMTALFKVLKKYPPTERQTLLEAKF